MRGYTKVIVEIDSMITVDMLKESLGNTHTMTCQENQGRVLTVKFQFVCREGNMVTDWLARSFLSNDVNLVTIDVPTLHVMKLLLEDKIGDL